ncbi:MAG: ornithine cyclodeaminase family protein [Halobacteriaceae archaeon]
MSEYRTRLVDHEAVATYAPLPAVIDAVEAAFAAFHRGAATMPPKSYVDLPDHGGDFRSMPAHVDVRDVSLPTRPWRGTAPTDWEAAGVKWVNVHPDNRDRFDLPTVLGTYVLADPANGYPLAVMDGRELTMRRTGAASAVATDRLAPPDADSLGIVGAGAQAVTQLAAISVVRDIEEVVIHDRNPERVAAFVDAHEDVIDVRGGTVSEAGHCDVLSTITPVESPIVEPTDVGEHTHVNAVGADAPGKHELADDLLRDATIVVDEYEQCTHSGEINVPWSAGVLDDDDLHGTLGAVVAGDLPGQTAETGVTVFDSTGLAIQDVAAAVVAYEAVDDADVGPTIDLLGV